MSASHTIQNGDTFPIPLAVNKNGAVTGLTPTVRVRDGTTLDSYLDWDDDTFKTSGWTLQDGPMTETSPGQYTRNLDTSLLTLTSGQVLVLEFDVTGAVTGIDADSLTIEGLFASVETVRKIVDNRLEVDLTAQELVLFDDDGTTPLKRWPLETDAAEPVTTVVGVQTKRKVSVI